MVEETLMQFVQTNDIRASDHRSPCIVLDIESLAQPSGSPKIGHSHGNCHRADRSTSTDQEEDTDHESTKKLLMKVNSQLEPLKLPMIAAKSSSTSTTGSNLLDTGDQWSKGFNRFMTINPRNILLIFATMSGMGTLILIYGTLAINQTV